MNLWEWLVHVGLIEGDPNYYTSGQAGPAEITHALTVAHNNLQYATDPTAKDAFWNRLVETGAIKGDPKYYSSGQAQPAEFTHAFKVATDFFAGGGSAGAGGGPAPATGGAGAEAGLPLHILNSPSLRWRQDSATGKFYAEYSLPGGGGTMLFEAENEQIQALFGANQPPQFQSFNFQNELASDTVHFGGNVAEVEGQGSWEQEVNRTISLALDQQNLPDWISNDPKAKDLLWVMISEDRTDEWFYSQLSKLPSFKERYPGVQHLTGRGLSVTEAVSAHVEFEAKLKTVHTAAGFSPEAITPSIVGSLIEKGYSFEAVAESYSTWKRMNDHAPALAAFNQVLQASGQQPLTGTDLYDFLQGRAPAEIYDIYEASAITEAAERAGLGSVFSAEDAISIALDTAQDLTMDQAFQQFQGVAAQALRFRHELDVGRYGLDIEDLIDVSFGRAPRSGKTSADIGEALARATQSAQGFLQQRVTPFVGFQPDGTPQAASMSRLRKQQ